MTGVQTGALPISLTSLAESLKFPERKRRRPNVEDSRDDANDVRGLRNTSLLEECGAIIENENN